MVSDWYLVVRGDDADLSRLREVCARSVEHTLAEEEPGEWRLRSATVESPLGYEEAWPALRDLLVRLSDVAAAAGYTRVKVVPGSLGRTRADGASDQFVFPETIRLRVQVFPPTIVVNGLVPEPMEARLLRLSESNEHLRVALHFLNADLSWFNLWKSYEVIRDANGGARSLVVQGWTSQPELERFRKTANTYSATGDAARHAVIGEKPPSNPMSVEDADDFVRGMLSRWVDTLR
jgi:hypothetical protein